MPTNFLGSLGSMDDSEFPSKPLAPSDADAAEAEFLEAERLAMQDEGDSLSTGKSPAAAPQQSGPSQPKEQGAQTVEPSLADSRFSRNAQEQARKENPHLTAQPGAASATSGNAHVVNADGTQRRINAVRNYAPAIIDLCDNLYFRYSMISDYITCPQLFLYKWVIQVEEEDAFFAAVMGTAGHACIEYMHLNKSFQNTYIDLLKLFATEFDKALKDSRVPPKIGAQFKTLQAQRDAVAPEYVSMLMGYQEDVENQRFHATCIEQTFALEVYDEFGRRFIFTGTIDQAGFHPDGSFAMRDVKFRANNFKPKKTELMLNIQLTIYTYALKYGNPSCKACTPVYTVAGELIYNGPCEACQKKKGTPQWPGLIAENVELLWMRDYMKRKSNEFAKEIEVPGEKELNPATGRMRKKMAINPKYIHGYKIGDNCGEAHLKTTRGYAFLEVHMADVVRLAGMIRDGRFYRNPGDHCNFWCHFKDACTGTFETDVTEIDVSRLNEHMATIDPFGGD
jgi:hypothetical protein